MPLALGVLRKEGKTLTDINFFRGLYLKGCEKSCNGVLRMKRGDFTCFVISFPQGHALETHMCITFLCSSSVTLSNNGHSRRSNYHAEIKCANSSHLTCEFKGQ